MHFRAGLCQVSAAKFSGMGRTLDCAFGIGPRLLPVTAQARQGPMLRCAPWPSNGFGSCFVAGKNRVTYDEKQVFGNIGQTRLAPPRSDRNNGVNLSEIVVDSM